MELSWKEVNRFSNPRPYSALSYRITGGAEFIHGRQSTFVKQDDIAFVPAGFDYKLSAGPEHLYVVHFDLYNYAPDQMSVFTPVEANIIKKLFQTMYLTWNGKKEGYQNATTAVFYKTVETIQRQLAHRRHFEMTEKMDNAVEYLHEHFTDGDLSVALLSEIAGISDTYFRRLFTKTFSVTPLKYINGLRFSYAEELLRSGYYTVEQIAEKVGFSNSKCFSTFIKKAAGTPPSKFLPRKNGAQNA